MKKDWIKSYYDKKKDIARGEVITICVLKGVTEDLLQEKW